MTRKLAIALTAAGLALPILTGATGDTPTAADSIEQQKEMWQERFRAAREEVANAQTRQREAQDAYKQVRHRRRIRGEEKKKVVDELAAAEVALEESEKALKELFETARRAGVPPGWMRMVRRDAPAAPETGPDAANGAEDARPEP